MEIPTFKEYRIHVSHTFGLKTARFLCEEILYVSDESHESHYRVTHWKNKGMQSDPRISYIVLIRSNRLGAEKAGCIVVDMTFLKTEGHITPIVPEEGKRGTKHYKVEFELVMIVDGRNLRYEARYPIGDEGQVQQRGQICIAAAFVPGTK